MPHGGNWKSMINGRRAREVKHVQSNVNRKKKKERVSLSIKLVFLVSDMTGYGRGGGTMRPQMGWHVKILLNKLNLLQ